MKYLKVYENFGNNLPWNQSLFDYIKDSFVEIEDMQGDVVISKCVFDNKYRKNTDRRLLNIFGEDSFSSVLTHLQISPTFLIYPEDHEIKELMSKDRDRDLANTGIEMQKDCYKYFNNGYLCAYLVQIEISFKNRDDANLWVDKTNIFKSLSRKFNCDMIVRQFQISDGFFIDENPLNIDLIFKEK